eukprot:TRINITY_DN17095_c0_g1_i1.p1 TRINITY_DN17095_c0_g1~~TRINITY_DN17095_c0_g1_i1.p1  ORF type:complete len:208 (+),score=49.49 TRINITY_DN17095_c0_g1_i1:88-711(+)
MTPHVKFALADPHDHAAADPLGHGYNSHQLSEAGDHLTYPRRPSKSLPKKSASWHAPLKEDEKLKQDSKFSPDMLLNSCPVLESDSEDPDDNRIQPRRWNALLEKEFSAAVQELREKEPRLFPADNTRDQRNSCKLATYPRSLRGNWHPSSVVPVTTKLVPHPPSSKGYDASGNGSTDCLSFEDMPLLRSEEEEQEEEDSVTEPVHN